MSKKRSQIYWPSTDSQDSVPGKVIQCPQHNVDMSIMPLPRNERGVGGKEMMDGVGGFGKWIFVE